MGGGRRGRGTNPFVVIMAMRLVQQIMALPHKPPATLGLMAVNTAAYFGLVQLPAVNGPSQAVCLQPASIVSAAAARPLCCASVPTPLTLPCTAAVRWGVDSAGWVGVCPR